MKKEGDCTVALCRTKATWECIWNDNRVFYYCAKHKEEKIPFLMAANELEQQEEIPEPVIIGIRVQSCASSSVYHEHLDFGQTWTTYCAACDTQHTYRVPNPLAEQKEEKTAEMNGFFACYECKYIYVDSMGTAHWNNPLNWVCKPCSDEHSKKVEPKGRTARFVRHGKWNLPKAPLGEAPLTMVKTEADLPKCHGGCDWTPKPDCPLHKDNC